MKYIEGDDALIDELMAMAHEATAPFLDAPAPSVGADMVNHPPHYQSNNGVECIEAIEAALGDGFESYLRGTAIKYLWRAGKKWDTVEDINKAIWYLERLKSCLNKK